MMKRACLYQAHKQMEVLSSESKGEACFDSAESRKTSVQNEQKSRHAAFHLTLMKKINYIR
jgi:hypothetical protein